METHIDPWNCKKSYKCHIAIYNKIGSEQVMIHWRQWTNSKQIHLIYKKRTQFMTQSHPLRRVHQQDHARENATRMHLITYTTKSTYISLSRFIYFYVLPVMIVKWLNCTLQSNRFQKTISAYEVFYAQYNDILYWVLYSFYLRK